MIATMTKTKPYYRVHSNIRVLNLFGEDNTPLQVHLDPRREYPLSIKMSLPNGTIKIELEDGTSGYLTNSRAVEIANFGNLFDGQFNDDEVHMYITKQDVTHVHLHDGERWFRVPTIRAKVKIIERTERAFKLQIGDKIGWSRSFSDIELTQFAQLFDGRFNKD